MGTRRTLVVMLTCIPPLVSGQSPAQKEDTLLLRDFQPKSTLHVAEHKVLRARFPVIDMHNHVNDAQSVRRQDPAKLVQMMDGINVKKIVILTGGFGDGLQRVVDDYDGP